MIKILENWPVSPRRRRLAAFYSLSLVILVGLLLSGLARDPGSQLIYRSQATNSPEPTAPGAQPSPTPAAVLSRSQQQQWLESYGWIDRSAGIVHIPIERAMQLLVQQGLPTLATPVQTEAGRINAGESGFPHPTLGTTPTPGLQGTLLIPPMTSLPTNLFPPTPTPGPGDAQAGSQDFEQFGCIGCHLMNGSGVGPSLQGVFGSQVSLEGGSSVTADENYLRESILDPTAKVVKGYQPVMPSFQGVVSDQQLADLIAYIKSLTK